MKKPAAVVLLSGTLFACAQLPASTSPPPPAPSPAPAEAPTPGHPVVAIRVVSCEALLTLTEADRAAASMFYLGYTAERRGLRMIDIAEVGGLEAAALGNCVEHPDQPAANAFMKAFADNGR